MDERLRFVARLLDGEAMSEVCRAFGISRKTGYKIFERYKEYGLEALTDRSRRPVRYANQLPGRGSSQSVRLVQSSPRSPCNMASSGRSCARGSHSWRHRGDVQRGRGRSRCIAVL
jgi:transposase-like protein